MKSVFAMKNLRAACCALALVIMLVSVFVATPSARAQTFSVLYSFTGGTDGSQPYASLAQDKAGNLYGTTAVGGADGYGVVFKLDTTGTETVLYTFSGGADGANPWAGLLLSPSGVLFGTTEAGGTSGFGTVFRLNQAGKKKVLYNFAGNGKDGAYTFAQLIRDKNGIFYGTTYRGGPADSGTVFRMGKYGKEKVLYSFKGGTDGVNPYGGVVRDADGNLYGTTFGDFNGHYGTVFKVSAAGKQTVLHSFTGGADGGFPYYGGVTLDKRGNVYGTTSYGGANQYFGTVFKVNKHGKQTVLYNFTGQADGGQPDAGVVRDKAGNLYGTTVGGGAYGHGTIFKVDKTGKETVLYSFAGGTDPAGSNANLLLDSAGNLYGTSIAGGTYGAGTVFKLAP